MLDFITVTADPRDESGMGRFICVSGLLHIKPDESFEIFKQKFFLSNHIRLIREVIGLRDYYLIMKTTCGYPTLVRCSHWLFARPTVTGKVFHFLLH